VPEVRAEINVTPLVDVCLVLLIIFMVVTPMLTRGVDVKLPATRHHEEKRDTGRQPVVSIQKDGAEARLYFDREALDSVAALEQRVAAALKDRPGERIFLKADAELRYGQVYPALVALDHAGSPGVELGTTPAKE
jgi:biopolymer transport protein ExbD